jgi:hypothetical protein
MLQTTQPLSLYESVVLLWFATAILAEIVSSLGLALWLRRRGVQIVFTLIGIPAISKSSTRCGAGRPEKVCAKTRTLKGAAFAAKLFSPARPLLSRHRVRTAGRPVRPPSGAPEESAFARCCREKSSARANRAKPRLSRSLQIRWT